MGEISLLLTSWNPNTEGIFYKANVSNCENQEISIPRIAWRRLYFRSWWTYEWCRPYATGTVLFLKLTFLLERQVKGERTLSERWAHAEWNLVRAYERWTVSERRSQTECKCEPKVNGERYVNTIWNHGERFILSASGVFLTLCFVGKK